MCGVAGIVNLRERPAPERAPLLRMLGALRHRGPDGFGLYRDRHAGLVHARLSILDLETGQQPLCNEDGSLWVTFNGEIFNYVELRRELEAAGHRFRTRTDTEVIVHAFEQWGEDCLHRFDGQWAFALWDAPRRRLVLARDRLGVRPLHLAEHDGRLLFASEAKALFAADLGLPRALDPRGLHETFTFWSVVAPRTIFAGVRELPPGHLCVCEAGAVRERAYWTASFPRDGESPFSGSLDDAADAVLAALRDATALRMLRADVPVGSYLSGGLDSALIAALGLRAKGERFRTFSLRFEDGAYDETAHQRLVQARLRSEHADLVVTAPDIARVFPAVVRHAERPLLRTAPAPMFLLSRLARDCGVKVVLTGEGADELFAGYDLFREGRVRRFWARRPESRLRPRLLERLYPYLQRSPVAQRALAERFFGQDLRAWREPGFAHGTRWRTTSALLRLLSPELRAAPSPGVVDALLASLPADFARWTPLAQDQYLELRTLLPGYILSSQGDRMLMAHSVEGRFPFLSPAVVDLACALPDRFKLCGLDEKHVLKRAARDLVPQEIVRRKKQPYRAPDARLFAGPTAPEWVRALLAPEALRRTGFFVPDAVRALWEKCGRAQGPLSNTDDMALLGVLSTQLLYEYFVRRVPEARPPDRLDPFVDRTPQ